MPKDPTAALALFEAFIEADERWFERADDSDGVIGDVVRAACRHWLEAAARCETPRDVWPERVLNLYGADQYGAREELPRRADLLLDEPAQRGLVARFESKLAQELEASPRGGSLPVEVFSISGALSLLAESLRDPDIMVRASLRYSPKPNPVQRQAFARAYLDADRPADALVWLQDAWGHLDDSRQDLLADALERLGRFEESLPSFSTAITMGALFRWARRCAPTSARVARPSSTVEGHPRAGLRASLRPRGALLGPTWRDRGPVVHATTKPRPRIRPETSAPPRLRCRRAPGTSRDGPAAEHCGKSR